jgi:hypothetical protein
MRKTVAKSQLQLRSSILKTRSLDFYKGTGTFVGGNTISVNGEIIRGRIIFITAGAAAARWLFEIIYHYAFPGSLKQLSGDLTSFSTDTGGAQFPLIWSIMMVLVIFTGYKYMAVGKWFWITLAAAVISLGFWLLIGYPQWVHPEQWPYYHPWIQMIPMEYSHSSSELARTFISNTSLGVNSISKVAVCTLLPVLFWGKRHRS